jgi:hypothetical protein
VLNGNELTSSLTPISLEISPVSPAASCAATIAGAENLCNKMLSLAISPTETPIDITIFVATDSPQIVMSYSFSAAQLPCSLISLTPVTPTAINCSSRGLVDAFSCVVVTSLSTPTFGFDIDASENCQYATMQRFQDLAWTNVTSSDTAIDVGLNQYRLVYSSIRNPPTIEVLTSAEITLGTYLVFRLLFSDVLSLCWRYSGQCHI